MKGKNRLKWHLVADLACHNYGIPVYIMTMEHEFDEKKDALNRQNHNGLSLSFGVRIFEDDAFKIIPTVRKEDGEERNKIVGMVDGKLYTAVFVWRGNPEHPRFISVRRSNNAEQKSYCNEGRP